MHSHAKTQRRKVTRLKARGKTPRNEVFFILGALASARIATRSVAGGALREKVSLIPLLVLGSRSARFGTCSRGTQTLQPRGIGRRPTLLLIRSQDRIDVVDILTVQGLSFLSLGRTN